MSLEDNRDQSSETLTSDERVFTPADIAALARKYDVPENPKTEFPERNPTINEIRRLLTEQGRDLPPVQTPEEREAQRIRAQAELDARRVDSATNIRPPFRTSGNNNTMIFRNSAELLGAVPDAPKPQGFLERLRGLFGRKR